MKDMYNNGLVAMDNSALSTTVASAIDVNRLVDNIFNGKNTPYIVVGILGIAALGIKAFNDVMEHDYSITVEKGDTTVSFAPQKN